MVNLPKNPYVLAGAAVVAALVYVNWKGAAGTGAAIGGAAVDLADGIFGGVVLGLGDTVGVPQTDLTECERAKLDGRTWDASFACPAGNFISYLWN